MTAPPSTPEPDSDLGFGRVVLQQSRGRFIARDGTPTARKFGLGAQRTERLYLLALREPWLTFMAWLLGLVLLINGAFALAYRALGEGAIVGTNALGLTDPFLRDFVFSVGVFTTNGTGSMHAVGNTAHLLVVAESLLGPLVAFIAAGLFIARLTRPRTRMLFSESAVVAPYRDGRGLMFRVVNASPSELTDLRVQVMLSWFEERDGVRERHVHALELERPHVTLFPLHLTVVHPITADSPLRGVTPERLRDGQTELLVHITAHEETFSTQISVRTSYVWDEFTWDAKFANIFTTSTDDALAIDVERLSRLDRLDENSTREPAASER